MADPANEALDEAVQAFVNSDGRGAFLTGYVLVAAASTVDDGEDATVYSTALLGGELPMHVILGLLDFALTRYRRELLEDGTA